MIGIGVEVAFHNAINEDDKALLKPLIAIGHVAASMILRRAPKQSRGGKGLFRRYTGRREHHRGLTWIGPHLPQPSAGRVKLAKTGAAGYRSYGDWKKALGVSHKNYKRTGQMWKSLRIYVATPQKVRVEFSGRGASRSGKKRPTNKQIGAFNQRRSNQFLLGLSAKEVTAIGVLAGKMIPAGLLKASEIAKVGFDARARLASAQRALKKAEKEYKRAIREIAAGK